MCFTAQTGGGKGQEIFVTVGGVAYFGGTQRAEQKFAIGREPECVNVFAARGQLYIRAIKVGGKGADCLWSQGRWDKLDNVTIVNVAQRRELYRFVKTKEQIAGRIKVECVDIQSR